MQPKHNFLYTHNPFYLISCGLILYGLQGLAMRGGDLLSKSLAMAGGISVYTILMIVTCIAVVRWGKVWEDARSIFFVVLISLVALSSASDELSIQAGSFATLQAIGGFLFAIMSSELLIRACRFRLTSWYRGSLYTMIAIFFLTPMVLGKALRSHDLNLANAGALGFSFAIGFALLLLIPALHRGAVSTLDNGTPWRWPIYPLAIFVVLAVLAVIRSHAVWMSFGVNGGPVSFEPVLLMPIVAATIVLVGETGLGRWRRFLTSAACLATPFLALLGMSNHGVSRLPLGGQFTNGFGSTWTLTLLVILVIYAYFSLRRIRWAFLGVPVTLLVVGSTARLPQLAVDAGLRDWMIIAVAGVMIGVLAVRHLPQDWVVTVLAATVCWFIATVGREQGYEPTSNFVAIGVGVACMFLIGLMYETNLALFLRSCAAACLTLGVAFALFRWIQYGETMLGLFTVAFAVLVSMLYALLVERSGWFYVAGVQACLLIATVVWIGYRQQQYRSINWPISSGALCFVIGVVITTSKTPLYGALKTHSPGQTHRRYFEPGL